MIRSLTRRLSLNNRKCIFKLPYRSIQHGIRKLESSELLVMHTQAPKLRPKAPYEDLKFGREFSDHMLDIDWDHENGWHQPVIRPYAAFTMDPACSALHYALQAFEGMKAYLDDEGNIRLFRPWENVKRMQKSCQTLHFPSFNGEAFLECLFELLKTDKGWIPKRDGFSLYIRPTVVSTSPFIGVHKADSIKLYVILSPAGAYYEKGFKAVSLLADDSYVRAWPKGTGDSKIGSNYAGTIRPYEEAKLKKFDQILWLFDEEKHYVTEVGTMNQFFFWINESGEKELITAPLDGTILPGVTRDSILKMTRDWGEFKVSEEHHTLPQIIKALDEKRIIEAFGAGTAAVVSPVGMITYKGTKYKIPLDPANPESEAGPLAQRLYDTLTGIQYGRLPDPYGWSVIVPGSKEIEV